MMMRVTRFTYELNKTQKQVANCDLNDFAPDPVLYQIFQPLDGIPEGNLRYMRNALAGLCYR